MLFKELIVIILFFKFFGMLFLGEYELSLILLGIDMGILLLRIFFGLFSKYFLLFFCIVIVWGIFIFWERFLLSFLLWKLNGMFEDNLEDIFVILLILNGFDDLIYIG